MIYKYFGANFSSFSVSGINEIHNQRSVYKLKG